ncbi:MAG TPA: 3-dehydroquinate synthase [Candidatus Eremiobacteraceae bacterium]|nr:3-dehydroquinate synthase [Candidatus Eremiobacteraceae bacterium]
MRWVVDGLPYPVVVAAGADAEIAAAVAPLGTAIIIHDKRVEARASKIADALGRAAVKVKEVAAVAAGERHKNQRTANALYTRLLAAGADRNTAIVAVGGGTLTDVTGFVAATYMRGVPWIPVATTLLGMVDAAIGGKTGIDLPAGKNLIGAFWEPQAVIADLAALDSLPVAQRKAGLAEVVKAAVVGDAGLLDEIKHVKLRAAAPAWGALVARAARVKADVVGRDPRDRGERAVLNLGHTSGHAIEAASNYRVAHGPAVAIGLRVAGILARERTGWQQADHARVVRALTRCGLPLVLPDLATSSVVAAMQADKKRSDGALHFVLPVRLGEVRRGVAVEERAVSDALEACRSAPGDDGW